MALGSGLWLFSQGDPSPGGRLQDFPLLHARLALLLFLGSPLLWLAGRSKEQNVQSIDPHPLQSSRAFHPFPRSIGLLWLGFGLTLSHLPWVTGLGQLFLSLPFVLAMFPLLRAFLGKRGESTRGPEESLISKQAPRVKISFQLAALFPLAAAPWLPLDNPQVALWIVWCGHLTYIIPLILEQISYTPGGRTMGDGMTKTLAALTALAWIVSTCAVLTGLNPEHPLSLSHTLPPWPWWRLAGVPWFLALITLAMGSGLWRMVKKQGLTSLSLAMLLGVACARLAALLLIIRPLTGLETALHLLTMGALTIGIWRLLPGIYGAILPPAPGKSPQAVEPIPESENPLSFGSDTGVTHQLSDRFLRWLIWGWLGVVLLKTGGSLGWLESSRHAWIALLGGGILLLWAGRMVRVGISFRMR
ncbi:MAG: hypothetical protein HQL52_03565 [Magnetococcales bacterium]|nr:hypothetical protein [Magnetococcales bacterium]